MVGRIYGKDSFQPEGVMDDDTGDKGDNELVCACVRVCVCEIR